MLLSWSENDLSLSSVNGFEGLDRLQHLLLAQLMMEGRSIVQALSRLAAQAANLFQPSPLAHGDSDVLVVTPGFISSTLFYCPVGLFGLFPGLCCSCGCPWAWGSAGAAPGKGQLLTVPAQGSILHSQPAPRQAPHIPGAAVSGEKGGLGQLHVG